jgi:hypothetical protein
MKDARAARTLPHEELGTQCIDIFYLMNQSIKDVPHRKPEIVSWIEGGNPTIT